MTRAEKAAEAARLRAEGLLLREIAERMGVATQTVNAWLTDPDGSRLKARKDSYRGTCRTCGAPTHGGDGPAKAPDECHPCKNRRQHDERHWTPERLIEAVRDFHARYGRIPNVPDWQPSPSLIATRPGRQRLRIEGQWPSPTLAVREFGSWNAMIEAAGFRPFDPATDHDWARGRTSKRFRQEAA